MHLTIAIPTYNRYEKLKYQLDCLLSSRNDFGAIFNVIVCDNCSTDLTHELAGHSIFSMADDKYIKNEKNVGLIGNLNRCVKEANGDFVWLLGDDDPIIPKELAKATQQLNLTYSSDLNIIFVNPCVLNQNETMDVQSSTFISYVGNKINEGEFIGTELFSKILSVNDLLTYWISAFWLRSSVAKNCIENQKIHSENLMLPLYLVGHAIANGNAAYWKFTIVQHRCDEDSWSDTYKKLVLWVDQPEVIIKLIDEGVPKSIFKAYILQTNFNFKTIISLLLKFPKSYKRIFEIQFLWNKLKKTFNA